MQEMGTTLSFLCPGQIGQMWTGMVIDTELERKQKKEEEKRQEQKDEEQLQKDCYPSEPIYDPIQKEEAMPKFTPKMKLALDP